MQKSFRASISSSFLQGCLLFTAVPADVLATLTVELPPLTAGKRKTLHNGTLCMLNVSNFSSLMPQNMQGKLIRMPSTEEIISSAQTGNSIQVRIQHPNAKTPLLHIPPTHSRNKPFLHSKDCIGSCVDCHCVASQIPILSATLHLQNLILIFTLIHSVDTYLQHLVHFSTTFPSYNCNLSSLQM